VAFAADGAAGSHAGLSGLTPAQREQALARWQVLRAHLEDGCPLVRVAGGHDVPERTLRRWLAAYRAGGLAALTRRPRSDRGARRMPPELQLLIEGLALRSPPPTVATVHRQAAEVALVHRREAAKPNEIWQADHTCWTCGCSPPQAVRAGRG
jgi:putative transposase